MIVNGSNTPYIGWQNDLNQAKIPGSEFNDWEFVEESVYQTDEDGEWVVVRNRDECDEIADEFALIEAEEKKEPSLEDLKERLTRLDPTDRNTIVSRYLRKVERVLRSFKKDNGPNIELWFRKWSIVGASCLAGGAIGSGFGPIGILLYSAVLGYDAYIVSDSYFDELHQTHIKRSMEYFPMDPIFKKVLEEDLPKFENRHNNQRFYFDVSLREKISKISEHVNTLTVDDISPKTFVEANAAYKKLAWRYHPDRNIGKEELAKEQFTKVKASLDFLKEMSERGFFPKE